MIRVVKAHTPLAEDQLLFRSMSGTEGLSQLFEFEVDLLSPSAAIDMKAVLGKPMSLEIRTATGTRFLNGEVVRFSMVGREGRTSRHTVYRATVRPWLWYLTRTSGYRIFQNKTVVEILDEVLADSFPCEKKLTGSYRQWEHCAQYNESDFAFVSRLMELEGIYYYFKHERNQHTLVLSDDLGAHEPMPGYEIIDYFASDRDVAEDVEVIDDWRVTGEVRSGRYTVDDFNFTTPGSDLVNVRSHPLPTDHADYEMYEWLGEFTNPGEGEHYARVRLEEAQALGERSEGHATVRGMAPGYKFTMRNSPRPDDNREYLVVSVAYALREGGYATGSTEPGEYSFDFVAQPTSLPFRAARVTSVPRTSGPQTAVVVGPEGEEIWTDQYGRVKLQFRWDRSGRRNENCSCFVRVSHVFAGDGFGAVFTPRIGQEVIVDFIGGHADRPIIVGRVYNPRRMPPFDLPGEETKSGLVTRSTPGGSPATANSLVFEDKMGAEFIDLHAERDLHVSVEADETHDTGATRTTVITGHESATYKAGEERHISQGALETIDGGERRTVTGGATETVSGGEERTISGGAKETISGGERRHVTGGLNEKIDGGVDLAITGGFHGTIDGEEIRFTSGGRTEVVNVLHKTTVNGPSTTVITGPKIINSPNVTYNSTFYTNNTTTNVVNTTTHVTNSSTHTINAKSEGWWRWTDNHGTLEHTGLTVVAADVTGIKMAATGVNASYDWFKASFTNFEMKNEPVRMRFSNLSLEARLLRLQFGGLRLALQELIVEA
ncbi:type VI secretion system Vgr family protein [Variovorax sp. RB2P76]|uniref:type VI secretion system Vgr family protein n=1 Tax=Variovorax sp. RB2P76 TaxID=3443736 RepID=UPI003F46CDB7